LKSSLIVLVNFFIKNAARRQPDGVETKDFNY